MQFERFLNFISLFSKKHRNIISYFKYTGTVLRRAGLQSVEVDFEDIDVGRDLVWILAQIQFRVISAVRVRVFHPLRWACHGSCT